MSMKLLDLCVDFFGKDIKIERSFRRMIEAKRSAVNDDEKFAYQLMAWLGARSYNEFLDYSLLAIKLNKIFDKMMFDIPDPCWDDGGPIKETIEHLLYDDRHDMYQNVPCYLGSIYKDMPNSSSKKVFWTVITNALIECINVKGTGDVSAEFIITES